jgi:hypothetical protein
VGDSTKPTDGRTADGRFAKGNKESHGGKRIPEHIREMLECATPKAAKRLIEALDAETVVHYRGEEVGTYVDHGTRVTAAETILNRLYGKPKQEITGEDGSPVTVSVDLAAMLRKLAGG